MTILRSRFERLAPFAAAFVGGRAAYEVIAPETVDATAIHAEAANMFGETAANALSEQGVFDPSADMSVAFPAESMQQTFAGGFGPPEPWMHRGDYTDMGVGGGPDGFYFIDSDSSYSAF